MVVEAKGANGGVKAMMSLCILEQELFDGVLGGMGYAWKIELALLTQPV